MNPEFLREGSAVADFMRPDRIVVGCWDARSAAVLDELYRGFDCPRIVTSLRNAEMIKYAANALLATLVSYSNEVAALCEAMPGLDEETVMTGVHLDRRLTPVDGAAGPAGIVSYLRAGVGFGGSCLPKDVDALRGLAAERGVATPLLDAVMAVNRQRAGQVVTNLGAALGGLAGRVIAVLGLAFKPGTDDVRDSPAVALIHGLLAAGASVQAYDPLVRAVPALGGQVALRPAPEAALAGADAVVIATACPEFRTLDWQACARAMRLRGYGLPRRARREQVPGVRPGAVEGGVADAVRGPPRRRAEDTRTGDCRLRRRPVRRVAEPPRQRPRADLPGTLPDHRARRRSPPRRLPGGPPDPRRPPAGQRLRRHAPPRPRRGGRELLSQVVAHQHAGVLFRREVPGPHDDRPLRPPHRGAGGRARPALRLARPGLRCRTRSAHLERRAAGAPLALRRRAGGVGRPRAGVRGQLVLRGPSRH